MIGALLATAWQLGEGAHPRLGPIRFAFIRDAIVTPVGNRNVFSLLYFSCERNTSTIAIELASATAKDDPSGLRPKAMPRLVCDGRGDIPARWQVNDLGDALAQKLPPSQIRACKSIRVVQELVLPKDWDRGTVRVEFEISPASRELESILYTCGEAPVQVAAAPAPTPATPSPPTARTARTLATGKTNLRAAPTTSSAIVAELPADVTVLLVEQSGEWWHVKSPGRAKFEGYIRQDRLVFK